ncbi:hypothetical protein NHX12_022506 [Muraenolepis orangiensis]|uniref:Uncharacterized protein n=1 Tax=Muraenolepis orangiensis TaxID=630683 RepID=A0A9Q0ENC2_9TELE|nr:hypothetical protein NHX12_022506 [Muraenolepis orangiensis]
MNHHLMEQPDTTKNHQVMEQLTQFKATSLTTEYQTASGNTFNTGTVRVELHGMGFYGLAAAHKPPIPMLNAKLPGVV